VVHRAWWSGRPVSEYFQLFIDLVAANPEWAGVFIFLMATFETIVAIGYIIPGTWLMLSFGVFVGTGVLRFDVVFVALTLGGIIGDSVSYWLGRLYGRRVFDWRFFQRHQALVGKSERFFERHGGKAVFLARILGPIRPLVPFFAGLMEMNLTKFMICNVASAVLGSVAHLLPGMAVGLGLQFTGAMTWRLVILIVLISVLVWLGYLLARRAMRYATLTGPRLAERADRWARALRPDASRATRVGGALVLRFTDPQSRGTTAMGLLGLGALASFAAAITVAATLGDGGFLARVNLAVFGFVDGLRNPWADEVLIVFLGLGDLPVQVPLIVAVFVLLVVRHNLRIAGYWGLTGVFAYATAMMLELAGASSSGSGPGLAAGVFPSGHAAVSVTVLGYLVFLCLPMVGSAGWRLAVLFVASTVLVLVGFAELYFGTLYLSRLLGGVLLGLGWLAVLSVVTRRHEPNPQPPWARALGLTALIVFVMAAGVNFALRHEVQLAMHARPVVESVMAAGEWGEHGWDRLPAYRVDFTGAADEPFNVQLVGDPAALGAALASAGWQSAPRWGLVETLGLVTGVAAEGVGALHVIPRFWNAQREAAVFVRSHGSDRLVLRLWRSSYRLAPGNDVLYLGTLERESERAAIIFGLIHIPPRASNFSSALDQFIDDLAGPVARERPAGWTPAWSSQASAEWGGETALIRF
jgi:membrane protein DedA with SNARE-associated domain/membrane-associated phospholipid phosphatase